MNDNPPAIPEPATARSVQVRSNFRRSAQGREIVIVLGMHRSGTSLLSNILHLLGIDMVDQPTHVSKSNETGFWERPDIVALHDEILNALGAPIGSPMHAVPLKAGWWRNPDIRDSKKRLHDLMAEHLSQVRRPWGFKDPRTCRLLPLWGEILEELDVSPRFVWAVRHPAEAAISMSAKNPQARPIPVAQSEVMWLAYNYDILRHAGRHWPIIVPYEAWFSDAVGLAKELGHELDVQWRGSDHELESALAELIDAEKRHHWAAQGKLRSGLSISDEVYRAIVGLRGGADMVFDERLAVALQSLLGAVQPFAADARDLRPLKDEVLRLAKDAEQLQAGLADAGNLEQSLRGEIAVLEETRAAAASSEQARLQGELNATAGELTAAQAMLADTQRELAEAEARHHTSARHLSLLGGERDGLRAELAALAAARERMQREMQQALHDGLQTQSAAADAAATALRLNIAAQLAEIETLKAEVASVSASRSGAKKVAAALQAELDGLRQAFEAGTAERQLLVSDRDGLQNELSAASGELETAIAERNGLRNEMEQAGRKLDAFRQQLVAAAATESELTKKSAGFLAEIERLRAETIGIEAARDEQLHAAATLRDEIEALRQQSEAQARAAGEALDVMRLELASALNAHGIREKELAEAASGREGLLAEMGSLHRAREALEQRLAAASTEQEALREQLQADATARLALADEVKTHGEQLRDSLDTASRERDALQAGLDVIQPQHQVLVQRLAAHESDIERLRGKLAAQAVTEAAGREAARNVAADMNRLKTEMAGLRAALRSERERLATVTIAKPTAA